MPEIFNNLFVYVIGPLVGAIGGFLAGKRKMNVDADAGELANVKTSLGIYREMIADLQNKVKELADSHQQIIEENGSLRDDLRRAHLENNGLRKRITELEKQIEQLKKQNQ